MASVFCSLPCSPSSFASSFCAIKMANECISVLLEGLLIFGVISGVEFLSGSDAVANKLNIESSDISFVSGTSAFVFFEVMDCLRL